MTPEVAAGPPPPSVREVQPADAPQIEDVLSSALGGRRSGASHQERAERGRGFVAVVSDTIPGSDMAEVTVGRVVGYLGLSSVDVGGVPALALGPLAVRPDEQHKGVATYLVQFVVEVLADSHEAPALLVNDDAPFWHTFGFRPADESGLTSADGVDGLQVLNLAVEPLHGEVRAPA
jgi:putative acetyltransferase